MLLSLESPGVDHEAIAKISVASIIVSCFVFVGHERNAFRA